MRSLSHLQRARSESCAVVPLWRAAWTRWLSVVISAVAAKLCYLLCSTEHLFQIQNLSVVHAAQPPGKTPCFCPRAAIIPLLGWLPRCVTHDICNPKNPDTLGDDSSFFAGTHRQWRAWNATVQACLHAATLLSVPRRDKFIGDRRPLDSREKSTGHSHLPYYPRLGRMILGGTEMLQTTSRATKDCSYLYEILPSRVEQQVIGPRFPLDLARSLERWESGCGEYSNRELRFGIPSSIVCFR